MQKGGIFLSIKSGCEFTSKKIYSVSNHSIHSKTFSTYEDEKYGRNGMVDKWRRHDVYDVIHGYLLKLPPRIYTKINKHFSIFNIYNNASSPTNENNVSNDNKIKQYLKIFERTSNSNNETVDLPGSSKNNKEMFYNAILGNYKKMKIKKYEDMENSNDIKMIQSTFNESINSDGKSTKISDERCENSNDLKMIQSTFNESTNSDGKSTKISDERCENEGSERKTNCKNTPPENFDSQTYAVKEVKDLVSVPMVALISKECIKSDENSSKISENNEDKLECIQTPVEDVEYLQNSKPNKYILNQFNCANPTSYYGDKLDFVKYWQKEVECAMEDLKSNFKSMNLKIRGENNDIFNKKTAEESHPKNDVNSSDEKVVLEPQKFHENHQNMQNTQEETHNSDVDNTNNSNGNQSGESNDLNGNGKSENKLILTNSKSEKSFNFDKNSNDRTDDSQTNKSSLTKYGENFCFKKLSPSKNLESTDEKNYSRGTLINKLKINDKTKNLSVLENDNVERNSPEDFYKLVNIEDVDNVSMFDKNYNNFDREDTKQLIYSIEDFKYGNVKEIISLKCSEDNSHLDSSMINRENSSIIDDKIITRNNSLSKKNIKINKKEEKTLVPRACKHEILPAIESISMDQKAESFVSKGNKKVCTPLNFDDKTCSKTIDEEVYIWTGCKPLLHLNKLTLNENQKDDSLLLNCDVSGLPNSKLNLNTDPGKSNHLISEVENNLSGNDNGNANGEVVIGAKSNEFPGVPTKNSATRKIVNSLRKQSQQLKVDSLDTFFPSLENLSLTKSRRNKQFDREITSKYSSSKSMLNLAKNSSKDKFLSTSNRLNRIEADRDCHENDGIPLNQSFMPQLRQEKNDLLLFSDGDLNLKLVFEILNSPKKLNATRKKLGSQLTFNQWIKELKQILCKKRSSSTHCNKIINELIRLINEIERKETTNELRKRNTVSFGKSFELKKSKLRRNIFEEYWPDKDSTENETFLDGNDNKLTMLMLTNRSKKKTDEFRSSRNAKYNRNTSEEYVRGSSLIPEIRRNVGSTMKPSKSLEAAKRPTKNFISESPILQLINKRIADKSKSIEFMYPTKYDMSESSLSQVINKWNEEKSKSTMQHIFQSSLSSEINNRIKEKSKSQHIFDTRLLQAVNTKSADALKSRDMHSKYYQTSMIKSLSTMPTKTTKKAANKKPPSKQVKILSNYVCKQPKPPKIAESASRKMTKLSIKSKADEKVKLKMNASHPCFENLIKTKPPLSQESNEKLQKLVRPNDNKNKTAYRSNMNNWLEKDDKESKISSLLYTRGKKQPIFQCQTPPHKKKPCIPLDEFKKCHERKQAYKCKSKSCENANKEQCSAEAPLLTKKSSAVFERLKKNVDKLKQSFNVSSGSTCQADKKNDCSALSPSTNVCPDNYCGKKSLLRVLQDEQENRSKKKKMNSPRPDKFRIPSYSEFIRFNSSKEKNC